MDEVDSICQEASINPEKHEMMKEFRRTVWVSDFGGVVSLGRNRKFDIPVNPCLPRVKILPWLALQ